MHYKLAFKSNQELTLIFLIKFIFNNQIMFVTGVIDCDCKSRSVIPDFNRVITRVRRRKGAMSLRYNPRAWLQVYVLSY